LEIIGNTTEFHLDRETAAAIGKFDGIHIGHRRLLGEILSRKKDGCAACVFTFDPPPAVFFSGAAGEGKSVQTLTTREEKRLLFERMGVDILIEFPLNRKTAATPPESFVREILAKQMKVKYLAAGKDLSFGAGGTGDAALLRALSTELGFTFEAIDKVCLEGREVSSTLVRSQVERGDMRAAGQLLGMPYLIAGRVAFGRQLGRRLGFPTVNVLPPADKLLPPKGVYFSEVRRGQKCYRAVSNVGCRPTVSDEGTLSVESYLFDFGEEIYGETVEVYLHSFHRRERRFDSVELLRRQLQEDIAAARAWVPGSN